MGKVLATVKGNGRSFLSLVNGEVGGGLRVREYDFDQMCPERYSND